MFSSLIDVIRNPIPFAPPPAHPPGNPLAVTGGRHDNPLTGKTIFPGNVDTMPFYDQGATNGCGTTSLAMIMTYLGKPETEASIDHQIRRFDSFGSPQQMVDFAHHQGLAAEMYNHGSIDELKDFVARGIPCQTLISDDKSGDFSHLHYVAVVGFGADKDGNEYVLLHNSQQGDTPGHDGEVERMSLKDFQERWSTPPAGFDNFFIAYAPGGTSLPPSRTDGIEGTLLAAEGIADVVNGAGRLIHPGSPGDFVEGAIDLGAGVGAAIGGVVTGGLELGGGWLHNKLDGVPVAGNLLNPLIDIGVTGPAAAAADIIRGGAQALEDLGGAVDKFSHGDVVGGLEDVGSSIVDTGKGIVDAVVDVGKSLVEGVKDFFSGW